MAMTSVYEVLSGRERECSPPIMEITRDAGVQGEITAQS